MISIISLVCTLAIAGLSSAAPAAGITPPQGFNITSLGLLGSGCPAGTATYVLSPDNTAVTVLFSNYIASTGPTTPITENRKNCQLALGVHIPQGFSFSINSVDYRGYYQLDNKVTAAQAATYYFAGSVKQSTARSNLKGPITGKDYLFHDEFDLATLVESPCGANTVWNINSQIQVNNGQNPSGSGSINTDSVDAKFIQIYSFQWIKC
jgi:hypothetical protein